ncbi:MAG TPA: radical SAM family heme chaperone HemW, partial [Terriglobales bacterium]|nr:radical SAM family heme chaperone HemW [Terriglobales bacterium]
MPSTASSSAQATLGLYLSVPFCRSKCTFCNFASQVHPAAVYDEYCSLLVRELEMAVAADALDGATLDSIYWGGGTPSLLSPAAFARVVAAIRQRFALTADCEHTVEVAPGTLDDAHLAAFAAAGVSRLSFGVQSFVDEEVRSVGRLHRAATVWQDLARARAAGFDNINLDLIAGLPHQTPASWRDSLQAALDAAVPHLSVYLLEVDADSRLGSELIAGGSRYHAHTVPDDDAIADAYEVACSTLDQAGVHQYEISNFARPGRESRHNLRYWLRQPYLGLGLDAHSMLASPRPRRFANPDDLDTWLAALRQHRLPRGESEWLTPQAAREEFYVLGLRRNAGID